MEFLPKRKLKRKQKFLFVPETPSHRHRQKGGNLIAEIIFSEQRNSRFSQQPTMPSSEYISATGGALKLKSKTGAGVTKPKKKKKPTPKAADEANTQDVQQRISTPDSPQRQTNRDQAEAEADTGTETEQSKRPDLESRQDGERTTLEKELTHARRDVGSGKTEAERRYEERRQKRLDERLRRDGVKTHKERVEELNRYLSRLSEHHDMPRIGPG